MQRFARFAFLGLMFFAAATLGCIKESSTSGGAKPPAAAGHDHAGHAHDHDHDHGAHGPHGGHLVELGDGKYHAEWSHDPLDQENAKNVTVYILGEDAKTETPIAAAALTINISGGKEPKQYELLAVNAQDGKASQFALDDPALLVDLGMIGKEIKARLNVEIDGTPYSSEIEHDHSHDDHGHAH